MTANTFIHHTLRPGVYFTLVERRDGEKSKAEEFIIGMAATVAFQRFMDTVEQLSSDPGVLTIRLMVRNPTDKPPIKVVYAWASGPHKGLSWPWKGQQHVLQANARRLRIKAGGDPSYLPKDYLLFNLRERRET